MYLSDGTIFLSPEQQKDTGYAPVLEHYSLPFVDSERLRLGRQIDPTHPRILGCEDPNYLLDLSKDPRTMVQFRILSRLRLLDQIEAYMHEEIARTYPPDMQDEMLAFFKGMVEDRKLLKQETAGLGV